MSTKKETPATNDVLPTFDRQAQHQAGSLNSFDHTSTKLESQLVQVIEVALDLIGIMQGSHISHSDRKAQLGLVADYLALHLPSTTTDDLPF